MKAMSDSDELGAELGRELAAATADLEAPPEWTATIARRIRRRRAGVATAAAGSLAAAAAVTVALAGPGGDAGKATRPDASGGYQLAGFDTSNGGIRLEDLPCMSARVAKRPDWPGAAPFSSTAAMSHGGPAVNRSAGPDYAHLCYKVADWLTRRLPATATPLAGADDAWVAASPEGARVGFIAVNPDRVGGYPYLAVLVGHSVSDADLLAELRGSQHSVRVVPAAGVSGLPSHR